jgi:hypothetical protein
MKKLLLILTISLFILPHTYLSAGEFRRLPVDTYIDKMKAGWIGQMAGVGWGGPTEFRWCGEIIPEDEMPEWKPELINQFEQDDIYVEMTFLRTLELYGFDASIRQAGIDFANSGYALWHANRYGRENLRNGIAPPDSGHPKFNKHADDIDYQIEADYAGLISPGMPNLGIELGEKFGRLMNYGDGLYGGQFVSGMYAKAFFETDVEKIVVAGLKCIPRQSQYAECIRDVLKWYKKNPGDWEKTWQLIEDKYQDNPDYRRFSCGSEKEGDFNIDAKINGAYIVMGMLYGKGDLDKTIIISTRCGQDSDCNPSNAAGVLFTTLGFSNLPERFVSAIDAQGKFSYTPYSFPLLVHVCETLVRKAVLRQGGRIEREADGSEVFVIPVRKPRPSALEQCWEAGPATNSRFRPDELALISPPPEEEEGKNIADMKDMSEAMEKFAPGWTVKLCGNDMEPGLHNMLRGKENVLVTHPLSEEKACLMYKFMDIPKDKTTKLRLEVGHHELGDWVLAVGMDKDILFEKTIGKESTKDGWVDFEVDLSSYAGKKKAVVLYNKANDWAYEAAYWAEISIVSE